MDNSRPSVSVVVCTFNGEQFVREQLDSILAQTYPIDEIIVQDDRSTDSTVEIVAQYAQSHKQIKLFVNQQNLGFNDNFRSALERAKGDLVAISDQDDIWYPNKIERQVQAIGNHDICGSAYDIGPSMETARYQAPSERIEQFVFIGVMAGHTMLISREFLNSRNQWLKGITYDWSLVMNALLGNGVAVVNESLNWHRRHEHALGNTFHHSARNKWLNNIKPYFLGWKHFRQLQNKHNWQTMYSFIESHTDSDHEPLAHRFAALMRRPGLMNLLKLCALCRKHKTFIYPNPNKVSGMMGNLRAWAFPAIFAYNNYYFDWAE